MKKLTGDSRMKWWLATTALCGTAAYMAGNARAQGIPQQEPLVYAGQLTDEDGEPSNGKFDIAVVLWKSATGASSDERLCETAEPGVEVSGGHFRMVLDQDCFGSIADNANAWVEIRVDDESLGRTKVGAVPYAVTAQQTVAAAPDGELAKKLADLQAQLDEQRGELDDHDEELATLGEQVKPWDSGEITLDGTALTLTHDLGVVPSHVSVMLYDSGAWQPVGYANRNDSGGLVGLVATDLTETSLTLRAGTIEGGCPTFDSQGLGVPSDGTARICAGIPVQVRVIAWR